jgi:hypothetical protein
MKKPLKTLALILICLAAGACNFENRALDDGADIEDQTALGVITVNTTRHSPVDAYACCFARQSSWGKISDADTGAFNTWGDFRKPEYIYDGNIDTWWQSNYSGDNHHNVESWDGRHWVLIDLGESIFFNIVKLHSQKANTTSYEVYASNTLSDLMDEHPDTGFSEARVGRADGGGTKPSYDFRVGEGMLDGINGEKTITLENTVQARYMMLRTQVAGLSADRTISELWVENRQIDGYGGFDITPMLSVYSRALLLLKSMERDSVNYVSLYNKVFVSLDSTATDARLKSFRSSVMKYVAEEPEIKAMVLLLQYDKQKEADALTKILTDYMDILDPPRTLPEVY